MRRILLLLISYYAIAFCNPFECSIPENDIHSDSLTRFSGKSSTLPSDYASSHTIIQSVHAISTKESDKATQKETSTKPSIILSASTQASSKSASKLPSKSSSLTSSSSSSSSTSSSPSKTAHEIAYTPTPSKTVNTGPKQPPILGFPVVSKSNRFNYASFDCGSLILSTNREAKDATNILVTSKDLYMLNQCSAPNKVF